MYWNLYKHIMACVYCFVGAYCPVRYTGNYFKFVTDTFFVTVALRCVQASREGR